MIIVVDVNPGICGMPSIIRVRSDDGRHAAIEIDSECPSVRRLAEELKEVDAYAELYCREGLPPIHGTVREHCRHAACPVLVALLKGIEAAIGVALPGDVEIKVRRIEE